VPKFTKLLLVFFSLGTSSPAAATPLFEDQSIIDVELIGQIHYLIENKENRRELPFVVRSNGVDLHIGIRVRGNSRVGICEFPPLRLDFKDIKAGQTVFEGQDRLKLVSHCRNSDIGDNYVLKEYIAYRIFNLLSDVSYRVRLLRISYSDTDDLLEPDARRRYGFVIESKDHLSQRVGGFPLHLPDVVLSRLNREQAALVYVFQYLIGNTDWSFVMAENEDECCHNGDLIKIGEDIYYIPYDFDLGGIVNAYYAKPDPTMRLRNVRARRYRGFCTDTDTLRTAIRLVKSKQEDIFNIVRSTPGLTKKDAEKALQYLAQFFDKAENEEKLLKSYEKQCID
jgi:hypothetical protein